MELALLKTAASLVAVLGLMALVVIGLRKLLNVGLAGNGDVVDIEILSRKSIHPKRALYVVKVLNKLIVLSSTEHGITSLAEITDAAVIDALNVRQTAMRQEPGAGPSAIRRRFDMAQSFGDFFQRPFNVVLWRAARSAPARKVSGIQQ
jgi:flagellar biogenesis protein FliO